MDLVFDPGACTKMQLPLGLRILGYGKVTNAKDGKDETTTPCIARNNECFPRPQALRRK